MKTQTSLVAEKVRIQQWAEQIKDCQQRPKGMKIETWCELNGITKGNYYYRLRRIRETCLSYANHDDHNFVELKAPVTAVTTSLDSCKDKRASNNGDPVAMLHGPNGISIEIYSNASDSLVRTLIGAVAYAE